MTGFYSGLRRYIEEEWSTEASKCDSNTDCLEECTQHLGECLDSIFPTAEGCGVGRMLMDTILKLVNKTVGQISLVKPTLFKIALIVFGDNLNSFVIPRYVFPFSCKAMTRTSFSFRSIVAILFCILNDLAFAIFNYRLILLTISCNSVYHIAIKMNSACLLRSAGASYDML